MNELAVVPVILAGGLGTRLWPLSRESYPKQFLNLHHRDYSLFQETLLRLGNQDWQEPIVVSNEEHRFVVLDQLHTLKKNAQIILEPIGKNTAPSLTLGALSVLERYADAVLVVMPADHAIDDNHQFINALDVAIDKAKQSDTIVTLGVIPTKAETGYGYIYSQKNEQSCYNVLKFVEKPDQKTAEQYVAQGDYLWNAGIFVVKASVWLKAVQTFAPNISEHCQTAWQQKSYDVPFVRPHKESFVQIVGDSIDYAVMEHCPNDEFAVKVVPLTAGWSDLGSWQAVGEQGLNNGDKHICIDSTDCQIWSDKLVALVGVQDIMVVDTPDALLVVDKNSSQEVKQVVEQLKQQNAVEHLTHRKVHRPWGWYDSIDQAERFKVKRICVKPKASLSLQKHYHRAEHWIVVKGTAEVQCGDKVLILTENQSTYIPLGEIHRLSNPGQIPLEIIEVQSGSYLEEDDIVRFADNYGR